MGGLTEGCWLADGLPEGGWLADCLPEDGWLADGLPAGGWLMHGVGRLMRGARFFSFTTTGGASVYNI